MSAKSNSGLDYTWEWCQSLLNTNMMEGIGLDFKEQCYQIDTAEGQEKLLKHVSGLANSFGGHIVFGIKESGRRIQEISEVPISQKILGEIERLLDKKIQPRHAVQCHPIFNPDKTESGVLVIYVPEAVNKPVAGYLNEQLIFAKRIGDTTQRLTEEELSSLYKSRFESDWQNLVRLNELEAEVVQSLNLDKAWLIVSGRPRFAGSLEINPTNLKKISKEFQGHVLGAGICHHEINGVSVGYRKFTLKDRSGIGESSEYLLSHLHDDGSFAIALTIDVGVKASEIDFHDRVNLPDFLISEEFLTKSLLSTFEVSIPYSAMAGSSGTLDLQVSIRGKAETTMTIVRSNSNTSWTSYETPTRSLKTEEIRSHRASCQIEALTQSINGRQMVLKQLLGGLLNNFGLVESLYFDEDGNLNISKFPIASRTALTTYFGRLSNS
jgi:hypothetical protein